MGVAALYGGLCLLPVVFHCNVDVENIRCCGVNGYLDGGMLHVLFGVGHRFGAYIAQHFQLVLALSNSRP